MNELELTEEQAREERLASVDVRAHWLYLAVVLGGSVLLMVLLMAPLDGTGDAGRHPEGPRSAAVSPMERWDASAIPPPSDGHRPVIRSHPMIGQPSQTRVDRGERP